MESTTTFTTSRTKHGHVFHTAYHVAVEEAELPETVKQDRWYRVLAPFITKVVRWSVQSDTHLPEFPNHDWAQLAKIHFPDRTYVVHTRFGTATIVEFKGHSEIQGMTYKSISHEFSASRVGHKSKALTLGTWKKYGGKRGHGMQQLRAAYGMGLCTSPESGRDVSEFEAVCRLTQGNYETADHMATSALYAVVEGKVA